MCVMRSWASTELRRYRSGGGAYESGVPQAKGAAKGLVRNASGGHAARAAHAESIRHRATGRIDGATEGVPVGQWRLTSRLGLRRRQFTHKGSWEASQLAARNLDAQSLAGTACLDAAYSQAVGHSPDSPARDPVFACFRPQAGR